MNNEFKGEYVCYLLMPVGNKSWKMQYCQLKEPLVTESARMPSLRWFSMCRGENLSSVYYPPQLSNFCTSIIIYQITPKSTSSVPGCFVHNSEWIKHEGVSKCLIIGLEQTNCKCILLDWLNSHIDGGRPLLGPIMIKFHSEIGRH